MEIKKKYVFELAWTWWEQESSYLFIHLDKTEKQFKEDVEMLLVKYGDEYINSEESWVGANNWIAYVAKKMEELGYELFQPVRVSYFGAYIIKEEDKDWKKVIGKKLFDKSVARNIETEKELHLR